MDQETRAEFDALKAAHAQMVAELSELKLTRLQKSVRAFKRNKRLVVGFIGVMILIPLSLYALSITKSFTFTAGNPTVASEVNANFDQLFTKVNDLAFYHPPIGSIIGWHKSEGSTPGLPASGEWVECNGQTLNDNNSPYHTHVIPNLNGAASGADSPGLTAKARMFLRGDTTSGTGQLDAFQGHWHYLFMQINTGTAGSSPGGTTFSPTGDHTSEAITDGSNGTPRTASETRPVNMSVVWIMKVK